MPDFPAPLCLQPWYLDATCGPKNWQTLTAELDGQAAATWPIFLKKKFAHRYVVLPPLTKWMGPQLLRPEFSEPRIAQEIFRRLLGQLPRLAHFVQDFPYPIQDCQAFAEAGFQISQRQSFVLKINDLDIVWASLHPDYRNNKIRRARTRVAVTEAGTLAEFYALQRRTFARQGLPAPVSFEFLENLDAALAAHSARQMLFARDLETGQIHAAAYLVWDNSAAYLLMTGNDPELRSSGAGILVVWEAIRFAAETLGVSEFDFLGSMMPSVSTVWEKFGAVPRPFFRVEKTWSPLWRLGKWLRGMEH